VSSQRDDELVVLDLTSPSPTVSGRIHVGSQPNKMILNRAQTRLYVANEDAAQLSVVDVATGFWVDRVRAGLGVEPIVYTGGDLWRNGGAELLASQPLWVAHYTQGCPMLPSPWTRWTFWQHTDRGAVPGIDGAVDLDQFAGTLGELHAER